MPVQTLSLSKTEEGSKAIKEVEEGDREWEKKERQRMDDEIRIAAEQEDGRMWKITLELSIVIWN